MRIILSFLISSTLAFGQTKTTEALDDKYEGLSVFFYRNTLRMLNQTDDPAFDDLIKDIEKMRFMMIDKSGLNFGNQDYAKLLDGYKSEDYEEVMTGRYDGRNFDIYLREQNGDIKGTVILTNDSINLFVLDIKGKIALYKAPMLFKTIDGSADIAKMVKDFTGNAEKGEKTPEDKKKNDPNN
ncbi:MAG: DUF4252 domain-containing protein [Cytophagales bacterium]|nr:DUF4252 domain-containing protein [Cytophagales bacterium]